VRQEVLALRRMHAGHELCGHGASGYAQAATRAQHRSPGLPALRSFMEGMRNPLDAVKSQRESRVGPAIGGPDANPQVLSPMSTNESEGSDESDAGGDGGARPKANGRIEERNAHPPNWNGDSGRDKGTLPLSNGGVRSVFNCTMRELDPVVKQDEEFQDEMHKLNQLYEAKLASLQAAHEESRRKLIISARVRNRQGVDVNRLMESAAARRDVEIQSKHVYQQAADSECFKVMLDSMSPHARTEADDVVRAAAPGGGSAAPEAPGEGGARRGSARADAARAHDTDAGPTARTDLPSSRSDLSEYGLSMTSTPSIAVSPTEQNGKHETVF
jgi:hypothetical protein